MLSFTNYALPISFREHGRERPSTSLWSSSVLLWADAPFLVTAKKPLDRLAERLAERGSGRVWLGQMPVRDVESRIVGCSDRHNLTTLRVAPNEIDAIGPQTAFFNPRQWPPRRVEVEEDLEVQGYARDQFPAPLRFRYRVERVSRDQFQAQLTSSDMPGLRTGLCGAGVFRRVPRGLELVGVVVDCMFHNQVIRVQHARHLNPCGEIFGQARSLVGGS